VRVKNSDGIQLSTYAFIDNDDSLLMMLLEEHPETLRCLAKAPLGERITKKHDRLYRFISSMSKSCRKSQSPANIESCDGAAPCGLDLGTMR
jgi:hypothetical protein